MFEILEIPHEEMKEIFGDQGNMVSVYEFETETLYPAMIERIVDVLENDLVPYELYATPERGGTARAERLLANAKALPPKAWKDALISRDKFTSLAYGAFVGPNKGVNMNMVEALRDDVKSDVQTMINRGYALEIAYGWAAHALRIKVGSHVFRITPKEKPSAFRL
jgi:hypothetical protein